MRFGASAIFFLKKMNGIISKSQLRTAHWPFALDPQLKMGSAEDTDSYSKAYSVTFRVKICTYI